MTSFACTQPTSPGVTPMTPLGGAGIESISSSSGNKVAIVFAALIIEY